MNKNTDKPATVTTTTTEVAKPVKTTTTPQTVEPTTVQPTTVKPATV